MAEKAVFYHAGCSVCVDAEQRFAGVLNPLQYDVEIVHLGEQEDRIDEAMAAGVISVPAFVIGGAVFHINHGANITAVG
ncbi:thioredoxin [Ochrobactrum vermis]|uniref:Thioredoxin n=1 Tax=Ochrobactrum vermis TaxID=1827297 RepID=A0ABU8PL06_9HYPH|nr:thioredoxin [Ochrobactrum vermis]PQZ24332.1 thioredoxin [Ochrobactrum vermis]